MPLVRESILPVMERTDTGQRLLGTAFTLGSRQLLTAGHVAANVAAAGGKAFLLREAKKGAPREEIPIVAADTWDGVDVGTIEAEYGTVAPLRWANQILNDPVDVNTNGFAHGYDPAFKRFVVRHFRGHVVAAYPYSSWVEMDPGAGARPAVPFWTYQLSFPCPTGLSGSPLLHPLDDGTHVLLGMIIGNHKSSMLVHESTHVLSATTVERTEQYAHLYLGEAVATYSMLNPSAGADPDRDRKARLQAHVLAHAP